MEKISLIRNGSSVAEGVDLGQFKTISPKPAAVSARGYSTHPRSAPAARVPPPTASAFQFRRRAAIRLRRKPNQREPDCLERNSIFRRNSHSNAKRDQRTRVATALWARARAGLARG